MGDCIGEIGSDPASELAGVGIPIPSAGFVQNGGLGTELSSSNNKECPKGVSISGLIPQPNAKLASEWKCAMITKACTSSATDQESAPLRRSYGGGRSALIGISSGL